jgi:hypothetical protein
MTNAGESLLEVGVQFFLACVHSSMFCILKQVFSFLGRIVLESIENKHKDISLC